MKELIEQIRTALDGEMVAATRDTMVVIGASVLTSAIAALEAAEAEKAELRKAIAQCAKAVGALAAPECSLEFKRLVPAEIRAVVAELLAEVERLRGMVPKWVPVSERLPAREEVLCIDKYGHRHLAFHKPERMNAPYQWDCDTHDVDDPTHWMPLPEAPHD